MKLEDSTDLLEVGQVSASSRVQRRVWSESSIRTGLALRISLLVTLCQLLAAVRPVDVYAADSDGHTTLAEVEQAAGKLVQVLGKHRERLVREEDIQQEDEDLLRVKKEIRQCVSDLEILGRSSNSAELEVSSILLVSGMVLRLTEQTFEAVRLYSAAAEQARRTSPTSPQYIAAQINLCETGEGWTTLSDSVTTSIARIVDEVAPKSQAAYLITELAAAQCAKTTRKIPTSFAEVFSIGKTPDAFAARLRKLERALVDRQVEVPKLSESSGTILMLPTRVNAGNTGIENPRAISLANTDDPRETFNRLLEYLEEPNRIPSLKSSGAALPNFLGDLATGLGDSLSKYMQEQMMKPEATAGGDRALEMLAGALPAAFASMRGGVSVEPPLPCLPKRLDASGIEMLLRSDVSRRLTNSEVRLAVREATDAKKRELAKHEVAATRASVAYFSLLYDRGRLDEVTRQPKQTVREVVKACDEDFDAFEEVMRSSASLVGHVLSSTVEARQKGDVSDPIRKQLDPPQGVALIVLVSSPDSTMVMVRGSRTARPTQKVSQVSSTAALLTGDNQSFRARVTRFNQLASDPSVARRDLLRQSKQLYEAVFPEPEMRAVIASSKELWVLPSGEVPDLLFGLLSFSASFDTLFLGEQKAVTYLEVLPLRTSRQPADGGVLLMADPDLSKSTRGGSVDPLPGAAAEARLIAGLYEESVVVGEQATEEFFRKNAPSARLIHVACHGIDIGEGLPFSAGLRLSGNCNHGSCSESDKDGNLQAFEVLTDLKLNSDVVVLAACRSGEPRAGLSSLGELPRSFLLAGAKSVVAA